jgi:hypothetical protein
MSDHLENEMQPLRESLLAELETARQAITELSNEQLEEAVGGGFGCLGCKPSTISRPSSPVNLTLVPRATEHVWGMLDAMSPGREPRLERSTSSPSRIESVPHTIENKDPKHIRAASQVKELMNMVWNTKD